MVTAIPLLTFRCNRPKFPELAQFGSEGLFERLGIRRRELVFEGNCPMCPAGESLRVFKLFKLSD